MAEVAADRIPQGGRGVYGQLVARLRRTIMALAELLPDESTCRLC